MPRYACLLLVILSLSLSFPFALASEQASHSHARPRSIHFHSSRIHPPSHPQWYEENHQHIMSSATNGGQGGGEERQQYLVQLKWPYTQQERKNVEKALGVNLTTYIPYDTFLVHMLPSTLRSLYTPHTMTLSSELSSVVWIGHYHPSYKLHASVLQVKLDGFVYSNDTEPSFDLVAITAWPIPVAELRTLAQSWVDTMIRTIPEARGGVGLRVDVDTHVHIKLNYLGQMIPIATFLTQQMQIRYVQRYFKATIFNKWARGLTDSGNPSPDYNSKRGLLSWDYNLHGENQIIGVADSGLDWKSCYFYDPKFPNGPPMKKFDYAAARPRYSDPADLAHRKVIQYVQFADGLDQNGHGTHVSNSVGGRFLNADSSLSAWNGMAWAAQLAFYDLGLGPGSGLDIPDQLDQDLFPWAYQAGARIHSNSWGISGQNWYADKCYGLDHFAWQFPDMLIISAAGNEGTGQYSNTIGAPSTAKNALTVGASVQPEAAWQGSFCSGGAIPDDKFCRIQAYYKSTYNQDGLAVFSSLGPSGDGRIKPELVAPGMMIVSARADQLAGGASCNQPPEAVLKWQAGTSMAAPVVAGQAAILRQYFTEGYWPTGYQTATDRFNPSAALLKAVLISSTVPLNGVVDTEGYMFTRGVAGPKTRSLKSIPSMQQGYGRMQLSNSMFFPGTEAKLVIMMKDMKARPFEEYVLQNTGDYVTMTFCVVASSSRIPPPRVTLVWTDPPGNPTSGGATPNFDDDPNFPSSVPLDPSVLVNDLDLTVTLVGSNLFKYYPNGRLSPDRLNNVERIELPNTAGFTYLVNVSAYHIGIGPQPFSLVVTGNVRHTTCSGRDPNEVFQWQSTAWSQCSKACDGGIQSRTVGCVSNFEGFVEDSYCMSTNTGTKPPSQQSCNTVSCSSLVWQWTLGSYSSCSVPCGGGARRRSVTCMSTTRFIDDTETKCIAHAKPTTLMECNTQPCNATSIDDSGYWWKLGACNCSAPCGVGSCTRTVSCMFSNIPSDDISCLLNGTSIKPSTTVPCNVQPCPGTTPAPLGEAETFTWHVDYWQACSVGCGGGTQLRTVRCLSSRGYFDDDALCSSQPKPATSSSCNNDACPQQDDHNWQWIVGTWGPCSKYHQYRERWVICANTNGGYTDGTVCEAQVGPKPSTQQQCTPDAQTEAELTAPVTYQWWAGRWGDPHRLCGGGIQTRLVWCLGTHGLVASDNSLCPSTGKPDSLQSCCHQPCRSFATWYGSEWQGCSDVDPCKGTEHRETICVGSDGLRLADRSVCQLQTPPTNTRTPCGDCTSRSANSSPHSIMISSLPFMTLLMSAVLLLLMLR